ncbi:toprim domain-containing protein [Helicobacter pylori]|nr:toprim domain-containing protein [Helicobacter pylori]
MAYIPNLTSLPLHEILLDNGYTYNKNKTSKNNPCLKHENEEGSLVIFKNQNKDGSISYTYKETHTDKVGNIITFCKDRNISVEDLIAGKLESYRNKKDTLQAMNNTQENNEEVQKIREEFKSLKPYDLENATLIKKREIDVKLLEPYKERLKTDSFNNLILATYLAFEDKRLNVIPIHQYGINKRLNTPLTTDKEGNIRDKPLKSITQGNKGIEVLYPNDLSLVKNVIVTENIFDNLAYLELQDLDPKESVLISTAGQFNKQKLELFFKSFFNQLHNRQQGAYNNYLREESQWQELVMQGRANDDFKSVVIETYTDIIKNYQREKHTPIYNKRVEKTREYRKPNPINKPQESFNIILAFDNDIKGKEYREKCEGILYALTQQFPTIYKPFSKDCNDDLKLAHIIESKTTNIHIMAEFLESSLEKLNSNDTPIQEKENIMDKLEQIDSIKPFNERLKGILENAKENLQVQSYTKGRGR